MHPLIARPFMPRRSAAVAVMVTLVGLLAAREAQAQTSPFPAPSRTVFKCQVQGKVAYSDQPCLGAQRIDVEPTRGLDKSSGQTKTGADVRNERFSEQVAEAIRPLTGMDAAQYAIEKRRIKLPASAKAECARLDRSIAVDEATERQAQRSADRSPERAALPELQRRLLAQRVQQRSLVC
jgi:hypothetical protein